MNRPSDPRRTNLQRHPSEVAIPAEIVETTATPPLPLPPAPPRQPPSEGAPLAILSWLLAILAGILAVVMLVVYGHEQPWYSWAAIGGLLVMGFGTSISTLTKKVRPGWTGTHYAALGGLIMTILSCCWCLLCVGLGAFAQYAHTPEGRAQIRAMVEESKRRDAEQRDARWREIREQQAAAQREADEKRRREEAARKKIEEKQRIERLVAARNKAILDRDKEVARRFQQGDGGLPPIEIPSDPTAALGSRSGQQPPLVAPHPLVVRPLKILPKAPQAPASEPPIVVRDLRVQPLSLYRLDAVSAVVWSDSGDTAWLLNVDGVLQELDAQTWQVRRELDLDGRCVSLARCRSHLLVARTQPGAILAIDPQSLTAVQEIPAAQVEQIAAAPASDVVFVRTTQHHSLVVLDLAARRIAALLTPQEALKLGHGASEPPNHLTYIRQFRQLVLSADGRSLVALGDYLHRWSVVGADLKHAQDVDVRSEVKQLGVGHHGLRITAGREVYSMDQLAKVPGYQQDFRGASFDRAGRLFDTHLSQSLRVFTPQGTLLSEYAWQDSEGSVRAEAAFAAPEGQRAIVFHNSRLYGVDLPPRLSGVSPGKVASPGSVAGAAGSGSTKPLPVLQAEPLSQRASVPGRKLAATGGRWCWAANGERLYWLSSQGLSVVRVDTLQVERTVPLPRPARFDRMWWSSAGLAALAYDPPRVMVFDQETLDVRRTIEGDWQLGEQTRSLYATSPSSPVLASVTAGQGILLTDLETGQKRAELTFREVVSNPAVREGYLVVGLAMTPDGKQLFAACRGLHRFWIRPGGLEHVQSTLQTNAISPCAVSGDGKLVVHRGDIGVHIYQTDDLAAEPQRSPRGFDVFPGAVLDRGGSVLWSGIGIEILAHRLDGASTRSFQLGNRATLDVALSPDGRQLVAANDNETYLLDIAELSVVKLPPRPLSPLDRPPLTKSWPKAAAATPENTPVPVNTPTPAPAPAPVSTPPRTPSKSKAIADPSKVPFVPQISKLSAEELKGYTAADSALDIAGPKKTAGLAQITTLTGVSGVARGVDGRFLLTPDGQTLYYVTPEQRTLLHRLSLTSFRAERTLTLKDRAILWVQPAGNRLGVWASTLTNRELWLVDPRSLEPAAAFRFDRVASNAVLAAEGKRLCTWTGSTISVFDVDEGQLVGAWNATALGGPSGVMSAYPRLQAVGKLLVRPDGQEFIADSSRSNFRLAIDGDQLRLQPRPVFPDAKIEDVLWNQEKKTWSAIAASKKRPQPGEPIRYYNYFAAADDETPKELQADVEGGTQQALDLALGTTHAFAYFTSGPWALVRLPLDGGKSDSLPMDFHVQKVIAPSSGNGVLLLTDAEAFWAQFP